MNKPDKIIIHHTGGTDANPLADTSHHTFKMVDDFHRAKGWGGCGYHYFIEKNGKVFVGRPDSEIGAHTIGQNATSLGICLAGNFDLTKPTEAQIRALKELLYQKTKEYSIPSSKIVPHRAFARKTCYGKNLSDTWAAELIDDSSLMLSLQLQIQILKLKIMLQKLLLGYPQN